MLLKYYYMKIPCFSGDEHTVKNYVYFFKTLFKKWCIFRSAPGTDNDVAKIQDTRYKKLYLTSVMSIPINISYMSYFPTNMIVE